MPFVSSSGPGKIKKMSHWVIAGCLLAMVFPAAGQTSVSIRPPITNFLQARCLEIQSVSVSHQLQLGGQICWVSPQGNKLALIDDSGGLVVQMENTNSSFAVGQRLRMTGAATIMRKDDVFSFGVEGLVVESDGLHQMREQDGTVFLEVGKTPFQVDWFNGTGPAGLEVSCEGPEFPLRKILDSELSTEISGTNGSSAGLDFKSFEGWWEELPDFSRLEPVKAGKTNNLNIMVGSRAEGVGLRFSGFFEAQTAGRYLFHIKSDDGSRLSIGKHTLKIEPIGCSNLPQPIHLSIGQILDNTNDGLLG